MICETVKVSAPVTDENPHGYFVINLSDLSDEHELFDESNTLAKRGRQKKSSNAQGDATADESAAEE